ncbi:DUF6251 family protein [Streptomyces sp. NBC_00233]|uniref:DUF6251 family protein n=1 Tax=Streptomyces sp. NBC_00233 TaxID=2975686 RepID=UPI002B1E6B62|nr:DUF6251 family protein [Streptomyces sp. NBC_00233]
MPTLHQQPAAQQVIHQHIHQAPPDRTVQRVALGSGAGAGAVAPGVTSGPPARRCADRDRRESRDPRPARRGSVPWGVVTVVKSVGGGSNSKTATKICPRLAVVADGCPIHLASCRR